MIGIVTLLIEMFILVLLCVSLNKVWIKIFGASSWQYLLIAPGVAVHELSHAVGCLITGAKIHEIKLFSPDKNTGTLGYVSHGKSKIPIFGAMIISLAPIVGCSLGLFVVAEYTGFETDFGIDSSLFSLNSSLSDFAEILKEAFDVLISADPLSYKTWIFIYFALSLSASIAPSSQDFKNSLPSAAILAVILYLLFQVVESDFTQFLVEFFHPLFSFGIVMVSIALIITCSVYGLKRVVKF